MKILEQLRCVALLGLLMVLTGLAAPLTSPPPLDLMALTNGSLGVLPIYALLQYGVIAEQYSISVDPVAKERRDSTPNATSTEKRQSTEAEDKQKEKEGKYHGQLLGSVIGGAVANGLVNAHKGPLTALCEMFKGGVTSLLSSEAGWLVDNRNSTEQTDPNAVSTTQEQPGNDPFTDGMSANMAASFTGAVSSFALGEAICEKKLLKSWIPKVANKALKPPAYNEALSRTLKALENRHFRRIEELLERDVNRGRAANFVRELQDELHRTMGDMFDGSNDVPNFSRSIAHLHRGLIQGASEISDLLAAGRWSAIRPVLSALNQVGSLACGLGASSPAASAIEQFRTFTNQLSQLNSVGSLLDDCLEFYRQAWPIIDKLQNAATQATTEGAQMLQGVGPLVRTSLEEASKSIIKQAVPQKVPNDKVQEVTDTPQQADTGGRVLVPPNLSPEEYEYIKAIIKHNASKEQQKQADAQVTPVGPQDVGTGDHEHTVWINPDIVAKALEYINIKGNDEIEHWYGDEAPSDYIKINDNYYDPELAKLILKFAKEAGD